MIYLSLLDIPVIVCASDDNFAMPLTVMLKSMLINLKKYDQIIIYILNGQIHESAKESLNESLQSLNMNLNINWINADNEELKDLKTDHPFPDFCKHLPTATPFTSTVYYRLLIPKLLPKDIKKVVYLDSDIIVLSDISHLWDQDVADYYLLAVPDMWLGSMFVSSPFALKTYKALNIPANNKYFNSGVLVMNLEKWRKDDISTKIVNYLKSYRDDILWHDQDGMNAILSGKWGELDPRWNVMSAFYGYTAWQDSPFDEETYNHLTESPYIIHYTGGSKPWHLNNDHPKRKLFLEFLNLTSWKQL